MHIWNCSSSFFIRYNKEINFVLSFLKGYIILVKAKYCNFSKVCVPLSPAELNSLRGSQCSPDPQLHFISQFMQSVEFFSFLANALRMLSSQCCPNVWDSIAQEYFMCNVGPKFIVIFLMKNQLLFHICLVACYLSRYNITEQSWLFLLNVGLGVYLRFVWHHWLKPLHFMLQYGAMA